MLNFLKNRVAKNRVQELGNASTTAAIWLYLGDYISVAIWHLDETVTIIILRLGYPQVSICCYLLFCLVYGEGSVFMLPETSEQLRSNYSLIVVLWLIYPSTVFGKFQNESQLFHFILFVIWRSFSVLTPKHLAKG